MYRQPIVEVDPRSSTAYVTSHVLATLSTPHDSQPGIMLGSPLFEEGPWTDMLVATLEGPGYRSERPYNAAMARTAPRWLHIKPPSSIPLGGGHIKLRPIHPRAIIARDV